MASERLSLTCVFWRSLDRDIYGTDEVQFRRCTGSHRFPFRNLRNQIHIHVFLPSAITILIQNLPWILLMKTSITFHLSTVYDILMSTIGSWHGDVITRQQSVEASKSVPYVLEKNSNSIEVTILIRTMKRCHSIIFSLLNWQPLIKQECDWHFPYRFLPQRDEMENNFSNL